MLYIFFRIPADFFDNNKSSSASKGDKSIKPKSILAHYSSSEDEDESDQKQPKEEERTPKIIPSSSSLPPGK